MALRLSASFRVGIGTRSSIDSTISGEVPQVTCGRICAASSSDHGIELRRVVVGAQRAPVGDGLVPSSPFGENGRP